MWGHLFKQSCRRLDNTVSFLHCCFVAWLPDFDPTCLAPVQIFNHRGCHKRCQSLIFATFWNGKLMKHWKYVVINPHKSLTVKRSVGILLQCRWSRGDEWSPYHKVATSSAKSAAERSYCPQKYSEHTKAQWLMTVKLCAEIHHFYKMGYFISFPFSVLSCFLLSDVCSWVGDLLLGGCVWNTSGRCSGGILSSCLNDLNLKGNPQLMLRTNNTAHAHAPTLQRHMIFYLFCTSCINLFSPELHVSWHWCNSCQAVSWTWLIKPQ